MDRGPRLGPAGSEPVTVQDLPALNATLNALAAVLLVTGYVLIRQGRRDAHRRAMIAAFATSALFLASYLVYHAHVTLNQGLRERFDRHVRVARWTLPIWLYVSVTGVIVYVMLYQMT